MFDVGASELLLIVVVAIVVIGPKDMPVALRTAGRWIGKVRRVSGHFRSGIENMIREAELEEMEKKWREQNKAILEAHPQLPVDESASAEPVTAEDGAATAPLAIEEPFGSDQTVPDPALQEAVPAEGPLPEPVAAEPATPRLPN